MTSSQTPFDGAVAIAVQTAHGIETRYISNEARGMLAIGDVPRVSAEKQECKPRRGGRRTTEDRTPDVDSPIIINNRTEDALK